MKTLQIDRCYDCKHWNRISWECRHPEFKKPIDIKLSYALTGIPNLCPLEDAE